jgi:FkbM family methyltransferase
VVFKKFTKLLSILSSYFYSMALLKGCAAAVEHETLLRLNGFKTVLDIGANRGQFALVARHCNPGARIISFEPLQRPASTFRKVFAKDKKVAFHWAAIGIETGRQTIHVSARDDSSSLLPISKEQCQLFPGTHEDHTETIEVRTLDEVISHEDVISPALLKLDVQGYELEALKGCESLIDLFYYVYVECSFVELYENQALADEVIRYLDERGFSLTGVYNLAYDKQGLAIQGDFLFRNKMATGE